MKIIQKDNGEITINGIALSSQQSNIVRYDGNIVVSASAGTGKTRTMVAKIVYDLWRNKTHKVIAAITFTIKAAQEIRDRLFLDISQNFIGTNNSFAIEEIIKPFMKDVYGNDFDIDFDTDYTNKDFMFDTFDNGIELMSSAHTIYSYCNRNNCKVHNKNCSENKKSFVFELALDIVKKSDACKMFLRAKYFNIYVDEYQDCDGEMHDFFMCLCETLKIRTFVVGDEKQSIYRWRGARPELFTKVIKNTNFKYFKLTENHRSCPIIQNYSNLLFKSTAVLYNKSNNNGEILVINDDGNWANIVTSLIDKTKPSALLRNANNTTQNRKGGAKDGAELLSQNGINFTYIPDSPIEQITTFNAWIYMAVARFILLENYSAFDFVNEVPSEGNMEKKTVTAVQKHLIEIDNNKTDKDKFFNSFRSLSAFFNYSLSDTPDINVDKLYETVNDTQYTVSVDIDIPLHCAMTLYKSKGLEFDQVIIFLEDYAHSGKVEDSHLNNHYVTCTRAKSKLIIINTNHNDSITMKNKLSELFSDVDCNDFLTKYIH